MKNSHFFFDSKYGILKLGGSMAKYSLWVTDDLMNRFCVPMSRDGKTCKEKVDLYEIDLLTVWLGKEAFIEQLKKTNLAPKDFNWNHIQGYIQYQRNRRSYFLPLLFERDQLLIDILNFQNHYRCHEGLSETQILDMFKKTSLPIEFKRILFSLTNYRNLILEEIQNCPYMLEDRYLSKQMTQKFHSCIQSSDYNEQLEYKNDILVHMLSYITFRRLKTMEYSCDIKQLLSGQLNTQIKEEWDEEEKDPDQDAFLTDDEKKLMYG